MIIALAGRRIDAQDAATPRFPLAKKVSVYKQILAVLREQQVTTVVSSAACGADLLALEAAGQLGISRRVILPVSRNLFRALSVTDRPGEWGAVFDQIMGEVETAGTLVMLNEAQADTAAFLRTNQAIFNEAEALASQMTEKDALSPQHILAVILWDGQSRDQDDLTADFINEAHSRGIPVLEIATL